MAHTSVSTPVRMDGEADRHHRIWRSVNVVKKLSDRVIGIGPFGLGVDGVLAWVPGLGPIYSIGAGAFRCRWLPRARRRNQVNRLPGRRSRRSCRTSPTCSRNAAVRRAPPRRPRLSVTALAPRHRWLHRYSPPRNRRLPSRLPQPSPIPAGTRSINA